MKTAFWIFAQYESATLRVEQVARLLDVAPQDIRDKVSEGLFPSPTKDDVWLIEDVATYLDQSREGQRVLSKAGLRVDDLLKKFDELIAVLSARALKKDRWINADEVAAIFSQKKSYVLNHLRAKPGFPASLPGSPRWLESEVRDWAFEHRRTEIRKTRPKKVS